METDSPLVWSVAGHSAHKEPEEISALNLTPYQTLEIATLNAGEFAEKHIPVRLGFHTI